MRVPYGLDRRPQHLGPGLPELVLQVDVGGRDERVDPRLPRVLHRLPAAVDVRQPHAREPADRRRVLERADLLGDLTRRLEVLVRRDREARLDDVHLEASQLSRHLELLHRVHREPRRLLAVPQRRVENDDAIHVTPLTHGCSFTACSTGSAAGVRPTISRRIGPEAAYPVKMRKRKSSWRVATIITLSTMTSSVHNGRRRTKSNSLKLQYRNVETISSAVTYVPPAIATRCQRAASTPRGRITADTTTPAAAGVGSPTKNRRSTVPGWTLESARRTAPRSTDMNAPDPARRPWSQRPHRLTAQAAATPYRPTA